MFTGIIEEKGVIRKIKKGEKSLKLSIVGKVVLKDTLIGDSISVNGICLTVISIIDNIFEVDVMYETLERSSIAEIKIGDEVNLERALTLNKRIGGHLVSGHIDGVGNIESFKKIDNARILRISAKENILKYVIEKGSITIDGVSLTVIYVDENVLEVSIIPHTGKETILLDKKTGDKVNLEIDLIGKYIEKLFENNNKPKESKITEEFLRINGF